MPAPGTSGKMPEIKKTVTGHFCRMAHRRERKTVSYTHLAKAVKRQAVRSGGIEEACGQTAQAAVAERVVLDLLEDGGINSVFLQVLIAFIEEAEIQQIVVDQAAYQELSGKVACTLLLLRFVPSLGKLRHSGAGDGLIKLLDGGRCV